MYYHINLEKQYGNTNFIFNIFKYFSVHPVRPILHGIQSEDLEYSKINSKFYIS